MGRNSGISWTHHTFNPWWGCHRVSPGCERCYAETFAKRYGFNVWGPEKTAERRFFGDKHWREPLRWNAAAERAGERHRVFCASMADVFEQRADLVEPRERLFRLIAETPALDWLLLTKRPENIRGMWPLAWRPDYPEAARVAGSTPPPRNIWLGCTTEDQRRADERLPHLLACRDLATVLFASYEPALGPVDFAGTSGLDWVIIGGESGPGARPFNLAWARSTLAQCRNTGTPVFVKQLGARPGVPAADLFAVLDRDVGESLADQGIDPQHVPFWVADRKGGNPAEWPEDLRVREYPEVQS